MLVRPALRASVFFNAQRDNKIWSSASEILRALPSPYEQKGNSWMDNTNKNEKLNELMTKYYDGLLIEKDILERQFRKKFDPLRAELEAFKDIPLEFQANNPGLLQKYYPELAKRLPNQLAFTADDILQRTHLSPEIKPQIEEFLKTGKIDTNALLEETKREIAMAEEESLATFHQFQDEVADIIEKLDYQFAHGHDLEEGAFEHLLYTKPNETLLDLAKSQFNSEEAELYKTIEKRRVQIQRRVEQQKAEATAEKIAQTAEKAQ